MKHCTQAGTNAFPTIVGVRQEQQILYDLNQCAQLSVFLLGSEPHQEFLQSLLQLLSVHHVLSKLCLAAEELTSI